MSDEDPIQVLVADMQLQFATVNTALGDLRRTVQSTGDEMRQRIATTEATIINELRDLGAQFTNIEARLTRLESR